MNTHNEIIEYIKSKEYVGALLVTGKWGSGKSYLIKEIAEVVNNSYNDKDFNGIHRMLLISLFDVDSIEMLEKKIKNAILFQTYNLEKKNHNIDMFANGFKQIFNFIGQATGKSGLTNAALSINIYDFINIDSKLRIKNPKSKKNCLNAELILVFDDFERCSIQKSILVGTLNEYLENKNIKTIIVADENKINEPEYKEYKEKLISRTIKIDNNYKEIIENIISNYRGEKDYTDFLHSNCNNLISVFEQSKLYNLRIFKSCLTDFERVYWTWKESNSPIDFLPSYLYKFCAISFEFKNGNYGKTDHSYYKYGILSSNKTDKKDLTNYKEQIIQKYTSEAFNCRFTTILDWIVEGKWDKKGLIQELSQTFVSVNISSEQKFLNYSFWDLEQININEGMPPIVKKAYNGELTMDSLITLLQKIHLLKTNNIDLPCKTEYSKIRKGFEIRKEKIKNGTISEPKRRKFAELESLDKEAIPLYKDIQEINDLLYLWDNRRDFLSFIKNEGKMSVHNLKDKCIDCFDTELLNTFYNCYISSSNSFKRELSWAITGIAYSQYNSFTPAKQKETTKNLKILTEKINNQIDKKDSISKVIDLHVVDSLNKKIKEISSITFDL